MLTPANPWHACCPEQLFDPIVVSVCLFRDLETLLHESTPRHELSPTTSDVVLSAHAWVPRQLAVPMAPFTILRQASPSPVSSTQLSSATILPSAPSHAETPRHPRSSTSKPVAPLQAKSPLQLKRNRIRFYIYASE